MANGAAGMAGARSGEESHWFRLWFSARVLGAEVEVRKEGRTQVGGRRWAADLSWAKPPSGPCVRPWAIIALCYLSEEIIQLAVHC